MVEKEGDRFGTVVDRQTKVHVRIVESGAGPGKPHTILGDCHISDLPTDLPEGTEVEVTISYDASAKVQVTAVEPQSGRRAETEIIRHENLTAQLQEVPVPDAPGKAAAGRPAADQRETKAAVAKQTSGQQGSVKRPLTRQPPDNQPPTEQERDRSLSDEWDLVTDRLAEFEDFHFDPAIESAVEPVVLCNKCGEALNPDGSCSFCGAKHPARPSVKKKKGRRKKSSR